MLVEKYLWFLNAAVKMRIDLDALASPELAVALNRPPHECAATFSRKSVAAGGRVQALVGAAGAIRAVPA
jgi:hypothetical protein